jgi:putative oxidoreductase
MHIFIRLLKWSADADANAANIGLLFLRVSSSALLLIVHGWPKIIHFSTELSIIDDPLHIDRLPTLLLAIFAEVICPLFIIPGLFTRFAVIPVLILLVVASIGVHPEWTIFEAQFSILFGIIFLALAITGAGKLSVDALLLNRFR